MGGFFVSASYFCSSPANQGRCRCLANKIARVAWAMMVRGEQFKEQKLLPAVA
jgi:hypothetical protein